MKQLPLYLFEDPGWRRFGPLTTLRPIWELRIGLETQRERIVKLLDSTPTGLFPRPMLRPLVEEQEPDITVGKIKSRGDILIVNGRACNGLTTKMLDSTQTWTVWTDGPDVVAAKLPARIATKWLMQSGLNPMDYSTRTLLSIWGIEDTAPEVRLVELKGSLLFWPWDMLKRQTEAILDDFQRIGYGTISGEVDHRAILIETENILIDTGAVVSAGAIIDASNGPVIVSDGARIMPAAVIMGPVVVGANSLIRVGAKIYGPVTFGPWSKVGGEVEDCIIQGYSNKQHEGYLGHALLGEWVNLGADTNNSDLKNNYSPVSATIDGETIDTGEIFFGVIIGDHVKTAINTQLNTGTVIGVGSNIYGAGFPPKTIGAFRWGGAEEFQIYEFEKFLQTARTVMARRDRDLSPLAAALLREIHRMAVNNEI